MFKFNPQQALTHQQLGSSHESSVYPYLEGQDDKKWVIKCIHANDPQKINSILQNILLTTNANSASVVPIKGHDMQKDQQGNTTIYLKMPRMQQNLDDVIRHYQGSKQTVMPLEQIVHYFYSIVSCLDELAQKQIAHRNLKPSNVLIGRDGRVYLSDLKTSDSFSDSNYEDSLYKAPETFFENWAVTEEDLHKADIWSLGMIIAKACLGDALIPISSDLPIKDNKDNIDQNISLIAYRYGRHFEGIIKELLALNPRDREILSSIRKMLEETFPQYIAGFAHNVARGPYAKSEQKSVYTQDQSQRSFSDLKEESPFLSDSSILEIDQQSSIDSSFLLWNGPRRINWPDWIQFRRPEWLNRPEVIQARLQLDIWFRKGKEWAQMNRNLTIGILASLVLLIIILVSMSPSNAARQEKFSDMMREIQRQTNEFRVESEPKGGLIIITISQLNDDKLNYIMNQVIKKLKSENYIDYLQHFKFVFENPDVTDEGLQRFGDSLLLLTNLKSLSLEKIGGYRISVSAIQNLVEKISHGLKNIESFCIGVVGYYGSNMDLKNGETQSLVLTALRNMKKLTAFHLFIDFINISDADLQQVAETLSEYGKNLKTLFIRFSNLPYLPIYITPNGLQSFHSQILSKMKKLSKLDLAYTYMTPLTDQVLETLGTDLTSYGNNLKVLSLSFEQCYSITDAGLKFFGYHLSKNKLKNLKYFSLQTVTGYETRNWLRQELKYIPELHIRPE